MVNGYVCLSSKVAKANKYFGAEYFNHLFELEENNFWFRSRNQLLIWALEKYFPSAKNFLEIGCGTGFVLYGLRRKFPELELSGGDIFINALAFAGERLPGISLFQMDAHDIPFECEFDVIGVFDVLEHIDEDNRVLAQIFRAMKPSGGIILTAPQHTWLWSAVDEYSFHRRRYNRQELVKKVMNAGFEILCVTSFVSLLLPLMFIARLRRKRRHTEFDLFAELKTNKLLNAAFEKVLGIERNLIKKRFSFPVGGSLLLVASRNRR
jgi:SAM-dependent methyltransferase